MSHAISLLAKSGKVMLKGQRLALGSLLIDVICSPYCSCLSWTLGSTHMPVTPGPQHTCHLSTVIFITTSLRNCEDAKEVISISSLCCDFSVVSLQCQPLCLNSEIIIQLPTQLGDTVVKNLPANAGDARDCRFDPWVGKIPWNRKWQPALIFLPGKSHGQRSLAVYSPWDHKESDTTEQLSTHNYSIPPCGWIAGYQIQCLPHREGNSQISFPNLSFLRLLPFQFMVLSRSVQRPRHHPWINSFSLFSTSYPLPNPTSKDIPDLVLLTMPPHWRHLWPSLPPLLYVNSLSASPLAHSTPPCTTAMESFTNKNWTMSFPAPKPLSPLPFAHKENPYPLSHILRVQHSLSFLAPLIILTLLFIQCISTPLAFLPIREAKVTH